MKFFRIFYISLFVFCFGYGQNAHVSIDQARLVPKLLNYQGYLTDTFDIPINDTLDMIFAVFDASTSGNQLWAETQTNVPIEHGVFSVMLGEITPIPDSVFADFSSTWLELTLEGPQILTPRTRITSVGYAYTSTYSDTAAYAQTAIADSDWVRGTPSGVLFTADYLGIARGGAGNNLYGNQVHTHTNLGVQSTTGFSGQNYNYCTITGGYSNEVNASYTTIGGGYDNTVTGDYSVASGGRHNSVYNEYAACAGGRDNRVWGRFASSLSGYNNLAGLTVTDSAATIAGGYSNTVISGYTFIGGGRQSRADSMFSVVTGGYHHYARDKYTTIGGGYEHDVYGLYSGVFSGSTNQTGDETSDSAIVICGGTDNTALGSHSFIGGGHHNTADSVYNTIGGGWYNGTSGTYATVGGGTSNNATGDASLVCGGSSNDATAQNATVCGGMTNQALGQNSFIGGGAVNTADSTYSIICGGYSNVVDAHDGTIGGGTSNTVNGRYGTISGGDNNEVATLGAIGGGRYNTCAGYSVISGGTDNYTSDYWGTIAGGLSDTVTAQYATIGGGRYNTAGDYEATISGGGRHLADGIGATVGGGYADTCRGDDGFVVNNSSYIGSSYSNSAAFNGQTVTSSGQTRVNILSKASGSFTIDHPLNPDNQILNHYFVESPEMVLIYRGVTEIGPDGQAVVYLPDYFDALNQNPMVQLTAVGTPETPYLVENVKDNSFIIAGEPGSEVHWLVTGDRKDISADITRTLMPVEQEKTGDLIGRSMDDNLLASVMPQLERMGYGGKFQFRTEAGRQKYEKMKERLLEAHTE